MPRKAADDKSSRLRFSIPKKDDTVLRWVEQQSNLSVSLRMLIRWAIQAYGYADVTCLSVKRDRGRPSGTAEPVFYESVTPDVPNVSSVPQDFVPAPAPVSVPMTSADKPAAAPVVTTSSEEPVAHAVPVSDDEPRRKIPGIDDLLI